MIDAEEFKEKFENVYLINIDDSDQNNAKKAIYEILKIEYLQENVKNNDFKVLFEIRNIINIKKLNTDNQKLYMKVYSICYKIMIFGIDGCLKICNAKYHYNDNHEFLFDDTFADYFHPPKIKVNIHNLPFS